jgi:hypothetical protein
MSSPGHTEVMQGGGGEGGYWWSAGSYKPNRKINGSHGGFTAIISNSSAFVTLKSAQKTAQDASSAVEPAQVALPVWDKDLWLLAQVHQAEMLIGCRQCLQTVVSSSEGFTWPPGGGHPR